MRISVSDVSLTTRWIESFFGVSPIERSLIFSSFKLGGAILDIVAADEKSPAGHKGCVGYWLIDDLDEALQAAVSQGAIVYRGPLEVLEVKRRIAQIQIPGGVILGLEAPL